MADGAGDHGDGLFHRLIRFLRLDRKGKSLLEFNPYRRYLPISRHSRLQRRDRLTERRGLESPRADRVAACYPVPLAGGHLPDCPHPDRHP